MSELHETLSIDARLETQHALLSAIIGLLENGRRTFAPDLEDLQWKGPAHSAYMAARWMFDQEVIAAIEALRGARDATSTAIQTLGNRG